MIAARTCIASRMHTPRSMNSVFNASPRQRRSVQARRENGSEAGQGLGKRKALASLLIVGTPLSATGLDHPLKGRWRSFRDAHIEPDWLLIYKLGGDTVRFELRAAA